MVDSIRQVEQALGDGIKRPVAAELINREPARKSVVAACAIKQGDIFTEAHLAVMRPETACRQRGTGRYWANLPVGIMRKVKA